MGKTELIHAVEKNNLDCVNIILEAAMRTKQDINMNHYDKRGRSAIKYASINVKSAVTPNGGDI